MDDILNLFLEAPDLVDINKHWAEIQYNNNGFK